MNINFELEHQYKLYLMRMKLDEATMHPEQKIQVKQAFYGGIGQLLVVMRKELLLLPERTAVRVLESMNTQCVDFWKNDLIRHQKKNN